VVSLSRVKAIIIPTHRILLGWIEPTIHLFHPTSHEPPTCRRHPLTVTLPCWPHQNNDIQHNGNDAAFMKVDAETYSFIGELDNLSNIKHIVDALNFEHPRPI
jgi:hypothetical protein